MNPVTAISITTSGVQPDALPCFHQVLRDHMRITSGAPVTAFFVSIERPLLVDLRADLGSASGAIRHTRFGPRSISVTLSVFSCTSP
ncbi:hypothetical protein SKAU_G00332490 [Synaphobranchus kaupii]|uniref:Uncharacterized protein n=1 Tax=Synaphobranchus kaupii TaxID=118154 RepID=A0A9Q1ELF7_SYNKA|nr:hypothetical protein SKAU_G00332490 [Synaphobranchus kaupii]